MVGGMQGSADTERARGCGFDLGCGVIREDDVVEFEERVQMVEREMTRGPQSVGFIGLGLMGRPMAINLRKAGFEVTVWSRSQGPVRELVESGAKAASSVEDLVTSTDCVILMLPTPAVTTDVVFGEGGVLSFAQVGQYLIDMGTETPDLARRIAKEGRSKGVKVLDAPVSGGDIGAIEGTLSIMVGGESEDFEACRSILDAMGRSLHHVGRAGAGQTVKAVNQIIVAGVLATVAEGMVLLEQADVEVEEALGALGGGRAGSAILSAKAQQMLAREYRPGFRIELHLKDLDIVSSFARASGVALPVTALVTELMRSVSISGGAELDHSAIIEAIRSLRSMDLGEVDASARERGATNRP
jgi:2-hydroxy-3-oxopropionate reductase